MFKEKLYGLTIAMHRSYSTTNFRFSQTNDVTKLIKRAGVMVEGKNKLGFNRPPAVEARFVGALVATVIGK